MARAADADAPDSRYYGPFGVFDSRSMYGKGVLPEPFLIDDSDLEANEARFDWFHQESSGQTGNLFRGELEHGFGMMTVEVEVPYLYNTQRSFHPSEGRSFRTTSHGFDNVSIGARNPFFQYVSNDEVIDTTFGVGLEVGIPTNSPVSKNAELVPKLFNDLRIGDHFTMQTVVGYSTLYGSKPDGGTGTFEYGLVFGWSIPHEQLPLPDVEQVVPVVEIQGDTLLDTSDAGSNSLLGDAAFRLNLRSIGAVQPRLGLGYIFPLDKGGRNELRWGIFTSLVFEF
ncbi:MAG TPA: hypothetical protein VFW23_05260 [Tepidisphaeraceae bacterium]|nr:hypothetical protein [Tepidisphaeraceae bacterium]